MKSLHSWQISEIARGLSGLLRLGYPLLESVQKVSATQSATSRLALERVTASLRGGDTLGGALGKEPQFPSFFTRIIEVAESSGHLPEGLEQSASLLESISERHRRCRLACLYPACISTALLVLFWGLAALGANVFSGLFNEMHLSLPWPTRVFLAFSSFASGPLGIACLVVIVALLWSVTLGKGPFSFALYRTPLFGDWLKRQDSVIYLSTLTTLTDLGMPLTEACALASQACSPPMRARFEPVAKALESGDTLSLALSRCAVLPDLALWALERGEATGAPNLAALAVLIDRELETTLDQSLVVFEPILFFCLATLIGFVVVSLILPIYQLIGGLG